MIENKPAETLLILHSALIENVSGIAGRIGLKGAVNIVSFVDPCEIFEDEETRSPYECRDRIDNSDVFPYDLFHHALSQADIVAVEDRLLSMSDVGASVWEEYELDRFPSIYALTGEFSRTPETKPRPRLFEFSRQAGTSVVLLDSLQERVTKTDVAEAMK